MSSTVALWEPTITDVLEARKVIRRYLRPTPLVEVPALGRMLGCQVWLKCENLQPVGAFKVRGGLNLMSRLSDEERRRGVITASTGNHGLSIAYAARTFGVQAIIGAPVGANPFKIEAIRSLGAEVWLTGKDFDEARLAVEEMARERGLRYIHSMNEPYLIAGVGTATLEVMEELPEVDVILVPVGGGSGASGACITAKALKPEAKVIGVQAEGAPAMYMSWKERRLVGTGTANTVADGLATRVAMELPMKILWRLLDDMILVSDDEILSAIFLLATSAHQIAEGAAAATLAAAIKMKEFLEGKRVVLMISGANIDASLLTRVFQTYRPQKELTFRPQN